MTWSELRKRRAVLDDILALAETDLEGALNFGAIPGAMELYGSENNIMLALQYRWANHLAARMEEANDRGTSLDDAKQELADEQPALRAILDAGALRTEWLQHAKRREEQTIEIQTHVREYTAVRA